MGDTGGYSPRAIGPKYVKEKAHERRQGKRESHPKEESVLFLGGQTDPSLYEAIIDFADH